MWDDLAGRWVRLDLKQNTLGTRCAHRGAGSMFAALIPAQGRGAEGRLWPPRRALSCRGTGRRKPAGTPCDCSSPTVTCCRGNPQKSVVRIGSGELMGSLTQTPKSFSGGTDAHKNSSCCRCWWARRNPRPSGTGTLLERVE